jgi:membrane-bound inhibitor of C-type lysozyme
MNRTYLYIGGGLLIFALLLFGLISTSRTSSESTNESTATEAYLCRGGKSITADYEGETVTLTLSDTRAFVLPQAVSASGIRYEKDGVIFTAKGANATLEEGDRITYADCVATESPDGGPAAGGSRQFTDSAGTFTFRYPESVAVTGGTSDFTPGWSAGETTSGILLARGTLGRGFQQSTNFSNATFTVGTSVEPSAVASCLAGATSTRISNGVTYSVIGESDAAAGNRYDTTKYRTLRDNQCYSVEYTIHSTNLGNYSPDQNIREFDRAAVTAVLEEMFSSFQFTDGG